MVFNNGLLIQFFKATCNKTATYVYYPTGFKTLYSITTCITGSEEYQGELRMEKALLLSCLPRYFASGYTTVVFYAIAIGN